MADMEQVPWTDRIPTIKNESVKANPILEQHANKPVKGFKLKLSRLLGGSHPRQYASKKTQTGYTPGQDEDDEPSPTPARWE